MTIGNSKINPDEKGVLYAAQKIDEGIIWLLKSKTNNSIHISESIFITQESENSN